MQIRERLIANIISALLILLYVYTAASKSMSFGEFQMQMRMQALPAPIRELLIWTLPSTELLVAFLLLFRSTMLWGLYASVVLLMSFTIYVGLALTGWYERRPCSCGGVLHAMDWNTHFWFNIFFLLLNLIAITLLNRERRLLASS